MNFLPPSFPILLPEMDPISSMSPIPISLFPTLTPKRLPQKYSMSPALWDLDSTHPKFPDQNNETRVQPVDLVSDDGGARVGEGDGL
jgi:hypothetical protein